MAMNQVRGFGWIQVVVILAIVATTAAVLIGTYHQGKGAGRLEVQSRWDADKIARAAKTAALEQDLSDALKEGEERRVALSAQARTHEDNWRRERREARNRGDVLAACEDGARGNAAPGIRQAGDGGGAPRIRLTWSFVRQYDGAWSGADGQPVSPLAGRDLGAERARALAPYGIDDVLDVAGENAISCSRDRRELARLIDRIKAAGAAWDNANRRE